MREGLHDFCIGEIYGCKTRKDGSHDRAIWVIQMKRRIVWRLMINSIPVFENLEFFRQLATLPSAIGRFGVKNVSMAILRSAYDAYRSPVLGHLLA
jgi:hypothetical protein